MKFLHKQIPNRLIKILYDTYLWGYNDGVVGKPTKSMQEVKESLNKGFKSSLAQRKV